MKARRRASSIAALALWLMFQAQPMPAQESLPKEPPSSLAAFGATGDAQEDAEETSPALALTGSDWKPLDKLARKALENNQPGEAERLWKLAIGKAESQGQVNPGVVNCLCGLSLLNHKKGDFAEAERLYEYAMRDVEGTAGRTSTDFARFIPDLAWLYNAHGKPDKAEVILKSALAIVEQSYGPDSKETVASLKNYARFLRSNGRTAEASTLETRADQITKKSQLQSP